MSNVIRLVNGGSIQVRTGVMQGIGPQGPRGVAGPQGSDGPQGIQGDAGPMGQILQRQGHATIASNNPLGANTDTLISWGSVDYDTDLGCFGPGNSNITLVAAGDYMLSAWLRFDAAAAAKREIWFMVGATLIARKSVIADTGIFYVDLSHPYRATAGDIVNVYARTTTATGVSLGSMAVTRMGSGPPGIQGPTGPQGATGATGAAGPTGPAGSASSGFATYALLLPH